jgi:hypothetical protein
MSASPLSLSMHDFSHGTAVFVIRTPHAVVVAADSRSVSGNDIPHPEPVCKIRRFGNAYIVVHGMTQDLPTGYDVFSTLQAVGEQTELLADQIATFERLVTPPLEKTLQRLRRDEPGVFQRNTLEMAPLGVHFFGVEQGILVLYSRRFVVSPSPDNAVSVHIERRRCPGTDCSSDVAYVLVGAAEFKKRFARENPDFWKGDVVESARKFVQMQIDAKVVDVGPPIDILRITKDEATWIQKKPACEDKKESKPSGGK